MTSVLSTRKDKTATRARLRFALAYVLPTLTLVTLAFWPAIKGDRTLYLRDVMNTHLEMKWIQAEAMRSGDMPLVDPYRAGGQPHLGNPNTVALYPDNVLYLVSPTIWAMNAHFWLHLMLAPLTFFWLARAWGASREASWAGGVAFAFSGYVLSCLNLYNLIAPVVWAPALAATCLQLSAASRPLRVLWRPAVVWALLVLGGDPITAVLALALAVAMVVARDGVVPARLALAAVAIGLGTIVAAPMVLEFVRILSLSFRGHWGYSQDASAVGYWHPIRLLEAFLPLAFGRPDLLYWGQRFHGGFPPLLYSLAPGLVAIALAVLGFGAPRRVRWWSLALVGGGLFIALGSLNPVVATLLVLPGGDLLRLPIKAYLLVATGLALLATFGFERMRAEGGVRRLARVMVGCAGFYLALWLGLVLAGERLEGLLEAWMPSRLVAGGLAAAERLRWSGMALLCLLLAVALLVAVLALRRRPAVLGAALLGLHVGSQLFFLRPLYEMDETAPYLEPSPVEAVVPVGGRVVHGDAEDLFEGKPILFHLFPDASPRWLHRQVFREFHPQVGQIRGRYFEFDPSPEGLDSFLTRAASQVLGQLSDRQRIRLIASSGVEWVLLKRDLDPALEEDGAIELVARIATPAEDLRVYRLLERAAEVEFAGTIHSSETLNDAVERLVGPDFDPRREVVLAGRHGPGSGLEGAARIVSSTAERLVVEVEAAGAGALLVQRAHLPLYRARVDAEPAAIHVANLHRMAVLIEPGTHTVELWVDQRRWRLGLALSMTALAALAVAARWPSGGTRSNAGQ